jgi:hypothetical protein
MRQARWRIRRVHCFVFSKFIGLALFKPSSIIQDCSLLFFEVALVPVLSSVSGGDWRRWE